MSRLKNGFPTKIVFGSAGSNTVLWEKEVTPPALDGGEGIDTSNMYNTQFRTKAPRSLIDVGAINFVAQYDPLAYTSLVSLINVEGDITVTFPDNQVATYYGYLKSFAPNRCAEGEDPTANCSIVVTNDNEGVETGPAMA